MLIFLPRSSDESRQIGDSRHSRPPFADFVGVLPELLVVSGKGIAVGFLLFPDVVGVDFVEDWENQLVLGLHTLDNLDKLLQTPSVTWVVFGENNDRDSRLLDCSQKKG
ncbi:hypothetical protein VIGAN_03033200 [Vigna angularis var. angularis]|uniref:Uncharacterized protein n=1 Tax=Vigna angularis var. angularis TaxID=157739 RepID=A0A0S3RJP8_PHAAN|nr:hypothetical protein VIGAN_03033200 [Vigna angularis var. angularis]